MQLLKQGSSDYHMTSQVPGQAGGDDGQNLLETMFFSRKGVSHISPEVQKGGTFYTSWLNLNNWVVGYTIVF